MIPSLATLLDEAVRSGAFPAAQACVIFEGAVVHSSAHGAILSGPTTEATRFDVASLTKVVATTSLAYTLLSRRALELDERVIPLLPELVGTHKEEIRLRHLLAHTSGLPAWLPLFAEASEESDRSTNGNGSGDRARLITDAMERRRRRIIDLAAAAPLERYPGIECVYSDLGFILLGELLARVAGRPLDELFQAAIAAPLGLSSTTFRPLASHASEDRDAPNEPAIAPTGRSRPRPPAPGQERYFPGEVHFAADPPEPPGVVDDDNAWAMGGIAGHAGLFSTALDIARWGAAIQEERRGAGSLGEKEVLEELLRPNRHQGPPRALGFDLPDGEGSSAGSKLGRLGPAGGAGHLGFTGCSVWIDFDRSLSVALLTNRVYPSRENPDGIRSFRPVFHDAVIDALALGP